ncbi:MAG: outer membrane beta-barrel protein [Bacteroidales bacterium]|jgi:hypothetical protein|nr:outer membrane beta-barrel protein [Bacteroidales bacterium]
MNQSIFFIIILLFSTLLLNAQSGSQRATITGLVKESPTQEAVSQATVRLLQLPDSVLKAGVLTGNDGTFSLRNVAQGNYALQISYLGFKTHTQALAVGKNDLALPEILLRPDALMLAEAVVVGQVASVVVKNDTVEYNAAAFKTPENAVVEDLLKKMSGAGVEVTDGKVTVNGKEVKKFLVDGKDFFSDDPQVAMKNLPAEMVEKLQVYDRKSDMARMTGFDDGEEETIINLSIRQGMRQGTMGNVLIGAGSDLNINNEIRYQAGAFVNHMKNSDRYTLILGTNNNNNMGAADLGANRFGGMRMRRGGGGGGVSETTNFMLSLNREFSPKLSLNGDVRYDNRDRLSISRVEQTTLSQSRSQMDSTNTRTNYVSNNIGINFTLEWKPDTLNTLTFRPNMGFNSSHSTENDMLTRSNYVDMSRIFATESQANTEGSGYNLGGRVDFAHRFQKTGRVFSINLRGSFNDSYSWEKSKTDVIYDAASTLNNLNQRKENDDNSNNYRATVSWVEPVGKNNFIQALYRYSYFDTKSINSTFDLKSAETLALRNDSLSRSTVRDATEQRIGLSFKAVRQKYNVTVGFNVDPSNSTNETWQPSSGNLFELPYHYDSRLANLMGDSLVSSIKQDVVNFSPVVNFNYIFGQRSNLRIDYEGETNQPSATQLRDFIDKSRPTNWVQGNPGLKPGYSNSLNVRFSKYVQESQLMYNINFNGNLSFNDITAVTNMQDDGIRLTMYENVNGNWNTQLMGMFNIPLKNKRFTVNNFLRLAYSNRYGVVYERNEKQENLQKNFSIMDNASINYRSELFDFRLNASVNFSDVSYSLQPDKNQRPVSWGLGGGTIWYLPHNFTIDSDINYIKRSGYATSSAYNVPETMWNAAISKQIFNKKHGSGSLKVQVYDMLQNRNNISASATTNGFRTEMNNVIPSYFVCSFIYKFKVFPKSSSLTENDFQQERRWDDGRRPDGGGRRGRN